ncbi:MAG: TlpA family protein disulfide reductase [Acidobacteriota bacterium]|jgi:thiol-disulfide isomerase/thioredoxin|nr:TlpA family protein disulfide reductase [Acidobacteriota bacterium]
MKRTLLLAVLLLTVPAALRAQTPSGLWDATLEFNGTNVPFQLEIAVDGEKAAGWFVNGSEKTASTSGRFEHGTLTLKFDEFGAELSASVNDGALEGLWGPFQRKYYSIQAKAHAEKAAAAQPAPAIDGLWEIAVRGDRNSEAAWQLIVRQDGASASATILRLSGDTGEIAGGYEDGKFVLNHFSGARVATLDLTPNADGTLAVRLFDENGAKRYTAVRPEEARAKGQQSPADPYEHTKVQNPSEPLAFRFPDLGGRIISNTDGRFKNKVVLVNVSGSWNPNSHDQAPFLSDLYRKYRNQGLEIVSLNFEEASQLRKPERVKAFVKKYGIEYPVLIGGEPNERDALLTQPVNLSAWPTTFFVGRDGTVRFVRAGFPGAASGEFHQEAKKRFIAQVERLLNEGSDLASSK